MHEARAVAARCSESPTAHVGETLAIGAELSFPLVIALVDIVARQANINRWLRDWG